MGNEKSSLLIAITTTISPSTSSARRPSPAEWDDLAWLRAAAVAAFIFLVCGCFCIVSMCRSSTRTRVTRYDLLSAKEMFPQLNADSDSEDDLFGDTLQPSERSDLVNSISRKLFNCSTPPKPEICDGLRWNLLDWRSPTASLASSFHRFWSENQQGRVPKRNSQRCRVSMGSLFFDTYTRDRFNDVDFGGVYREIGKPASSADSIQSQGVFNQLDMMFKSLAAAAPIPAPLQPLPALPARVLGQRAL